MPPFRNGKHYFWRQGLIPLEEQFIERFCEIHGLTFPEAYNQTMQVMEVFQDMLLTHARFMLPGIGIVGISRNPKRGIIISSSTFWWSPGIVNLLAVAPGWENAPLNSKLTPKNLTSLNKHIAKLTSKERIILSPNQFYNASDFDMEGYTSDDNLQYYANKSDERYKKFVDNVTKARSVKTASDAAKIKYLEKLVEELGGTVDYDQI